MLSKMYSIHFLTSVVNLMQFEIFLSNIIIQRKIFTNRFWYEWLSLYWWNLYYPLEADICPSLHAMLFINVDIFGLWSTFSFHFSIFSESNEIVKSNIWDKMNRVENETWKW